MTARFARGAWWRLRATLGGRAESALIVPVPAAEPVVATFRERHDPSARDGMPAHVTSLYPFLSPSRIDSAAEAELESLLAAVEPFPFRLAALGRFPGVLYLAPEPAEPFVRLTAAIHAAWPDHPPYRGAFDAVVPHLTVVQGSEPPALALELEAHLPIATEASEVWLMTADRSGRWSARARFPLAARAA